MYNTELVAVLKSYLAFCLRRWLTTIGACRVTICRSSNGIATSLLHERHSARRKLSNTMWVDLPDWKHVRLAVPDVRHVSYIADLFSSSCMCVVLSVLRCVIPLYFLFLSMSWLLIFPLVFFTFFLVFSFTFIPFSFFLYFSFVPHSLPFLVTFFFFLSLLSSLLSFFLLLNAFFPSCVYFLSLILPIFLYTIYLFS
jgi:hypothetical protein